MFEIHSCFTNDQGDGSGHLFLIGSSTAYKFVTDESMLEGFLRRLRKMSDPELLRVGMVRKYRCSLEANIGFHSRESLATNLQLVEARKEWKRRYPNVPLNESF
jgi:hypothetical protein